MRKINYSHQDKKSFQRVFYEKLEVENLVELNKYLSSIEYNDDPLSLEVLVGLSFEELIELESEISAISKKEKEKFDTLFSYKKNQNKIARFFMKMEYFDFKSCFYCGIDFINAFKNVEDYQDKHDFLNNADISELQLLHGIGEKRAKTILAKRKRHDYSIEKKIKFSKRAEEQLDSLNFSNTHNHFTLDHIFPQSKYPYYSLCLYNLVPSCYSCNAKFKKSKDFTVNKELVKISPSSDKYSFDKDFEFSIYYPKELKDIKKVDDFRVENKIIGNEVQVSRYLEIFKLKGRYVFHKREVLQLIKRKVEYPDSKIKIKSRDLGLSTDEMKEILFGKELFDPLITDKPFLKLKRDIAKQIGIKGVVSH